MAILCVDGGYSYLNTVENSASNSSANWSGQKKCLLRKYMTVCTTVGRVVWSNCSFEGRMTDNGIMEMIITGKVPEAENLVEFLKENKDRILLLKIVLLEKNLSERF